MDKKARVPCTTKLGPRPKTRQTRSVGKKASKEKARLASAKDDAESDGEDQSQTYLGKRQRDDNLVLNQDSFWAEVSDLARTVTHHSMIAKEACEKLSLRRFLTPPSPRWHRMSEP